MLLFDRIARVGLIGRTCRLLHRDGCLEIYSPQAVSLILYFPPELGEPLWGCSPVRRVIRLDSSGL